MISMTLIAVGTSLVEANQTENTERVFCMQKCHDEE